MCVTNLICKTLISFDEGNVRGHILNSVAITGKRKSYFLL